MSAKTSVLRGPKDLVTKTRNVTRSMTTGTALCTLPKGSRILGIVINGVASDAGTSATLSFGNTATATEYVNGADVKTAASGVGPTWLAGVSGVLGTVLTAETTIYAIYAETGTASNAGSWKATVIYTTGNAINDTTI